MSSSWLVPRQNNGNLSGSENDREVPFWWTRTGVIVKWSIFLGFTVIFLAWIVGGSIHAKRRIRKGLKPLGYHRMFVSRNELARVDPAYAYPQATYMHYQPGPGYYGMQSMPPPPVYDPNRPPMYPGGPMPMPQGSSKIDPEQAGGGYAPPPGPPPPAAQNPQRTGGSNNPFADPPRL
ncbi:hypothetical protein BKA67DRAFT_202062 [Truncatella angustata]|uniref:Uncharacterized protein n=1 Tax=Truncatella angustata TaxID=152316 RepID=A0A9P9A1A7_9PEZI|nr:uncharacterized protein BKA67DRAFT_202062 [Truncatella angustata]KAH6657889.1 hypothetical protein BKA67DRAFT_202062 [Truncatella angustata]KAH8196290.1 hypothetical protein TruAng_009538 [Truncatella angustata]